MELLTFFARSILVLFLFLAVYQLFLRSDAHYVANRFFLLGGLLASLVLPFAEFHYTVFLEVVESVAEAVPFVPTETIANQLPQVKEPMFTWPQLLRGFYGLVTVAFVLRLILMTARMHRLANSSEQIVVDGAIVCINEQVDEPFVFGKRIFLKNKEYLTEEHAEILVHERVHLFQRHWIDVLVSELVIAVQWFNPFAWYYARVVKHNLEFLADRGVLKKGFQLNNYIQHIICETMGAEASVLANHFRFSQNKRRLKMMKNDKNSKWRLLKLLLVLPLVGSLLWAFSEPVYEYRSNPEIINDASIQDIKGKFILKGNVFSQIDTQMVRNTKTGMYEEKVLGFPMPGTAIVLKGTNVGTVADENGSFELSVEVGDELVLSFVGYETKFVKITNAEKLDLLMSKASIELDPSQVMPKPRHTDVKPDKNRKEVFYIVEEMPSYKEGEETFAKKLQKKIDAAKVKDNLSGNVKVMFLVSHTGELKDIKAISRMGEKEAEYAVKFISELDEWYPGKQRGKSVDCQLVIPVVFD